MSEKKKKEKNVNGIGICQGNNEDNRSNPKRRVKITRPCYFSGPSCSKLTTSLVNDSLKFTSSDTQIF